MKRSVFIRNVITIVSILVGMTSCRKRFVESMEELKFHTHVFGLFQMTDRGFLLTTARSNIDAKCIYSCEPTSISTFRDICLIRTDSVGNVLWEKTFHEVGDEGDFKAVITADNHLLIAGNVGESDFVNNGFTTHGFVAKFTLDGELLWRKTQETSRTQNFSAFSISKDGDIAKSIYKINQNKYTYGFVVFDKDGNKKWENLIDSGKSNFMEAVFLSNDELIAFRNNDTNMATADERLLEKFDKNGRLLWKRPLTFPIENLAKASDNGFWAIGKGGWIGRFSTNGDLIWSKNLTLLKGRLIHFAPNASGKLLLEILEGGYTLAQLNYILVNDEKEVEANKILPAKSRSLPSPALFNTPEFAHLLPDKSVILVELEEKNFLGKTLKENHSDYRLVLSKFNSQGERLWTNTVGRGKKTGPMPLLEDF